MKTAITKLLCAISLHRWKVTRQEVYANKKTALLGITESPRERKCQCCGKEQWLHITCLGLNPPDYMEEWRDK